VVIFDEFDAIARTRGGRGGSQGDAGVARDSIVNQFLTCLDGVEPPVVPTLVIGLTNKRSLIDPGKLESLTQRRRSHW
jgi:SpoVK/Ycf46/Vps4 family AAA+-type ATPase